MVKISLAIIFFLSSLCFGAMMFDGDDFISMGDVDSLDRTSADDFTIEALFYVDEVSVGIIAGKSDTGYTEGYVIYCNFGVHPQKFVLGLGDGTLEETWTYSGAVLNEYEWNYIAAVKISTSIIYYCNGVYDSTVDPINDDTIATAFAFTIGTRKDGTGEMYDNAISRVVVHDRGLSADEIASRMDRWTPPDSDVLGEWRLDGQAGNWVYDSSSGGNHGEITGAVWSDNPPVTTLPGVLIQ